MGSTEDLGVSVYGTRALVLRLGQENVKCASETACIHVHTCGSVHVCVGVSKPDTKFGRLAANLNRGLVKNKEKTESQLSPCFVQHLGASWFES